jgi:hypothetical protein
MTRLENRDAEEPCLPCLVGQRLATEMVWCDNCPKQVCLGHATPVVMKAWSITSLAFLCPVCKHIPKAFIRSV